MDQVRRVEQQRDTSDSRGQQESASCEAARSSLEGRSVPGIAHSPGTDRQIVCFLQVPRLEMARLGQSTERARGESSNHGHCEADNVAQQRETPAQDRYLPRHETV